MGTVKTEITLMNSGDVIKARDGIIKAADIHAITVEAAVDTGRAEDMDMEGFSLEQSPGQSKSVASITALIVCLRFSASSQTRLWGPSITSAVTSSPRTAGRQWRKMLSLRPVRFISA